MEGLFNTLDEAVERLRRDHPLIVLISCLVAWLAASAIVVTLFASDNPRPYFPALFLVLPLGMMAATAVWGLGSLDWPAWPVGVSPVVIVGTLVAPSVELALPRLHPSLLGTFIVMLVGYLYVQVYVAALVSIHTLRTRRPDREPIAWRRALQLKLLVAVAILAWAVTAGVAVRPTRQPTSGWRFALAVTLSLALLFPGVALYVRERWSALAAAGLAAVSALGPLTVTEPGKWLPYLTRAAPAGTVVVLLFVKASTRPYWLPATPAPQPPTPGGRSNLATVSLALSIFGVLTLCCYGIGGVFGLAGAVIGQVALYQIPRHGQYGRHVAQAGAGLGWASVVVALFFLLVP